MARLMIDLEIDERDALIALSQRERRDPRDQAALFVRDGLERAGLIETRVAESQTKMSGLRDTEHRTCTAM